MEPLGKDPVVFKLRFDDLIKLPGIEVRDPRDPGI